jgi:hypothetical protein
MIAWNYLCWTGVLSVVLDFAWINWEGFCVIRNGSIGYYNIHIIDMLRYAMLVL